LHYGTALDDLAEEVANIAEYKGFWDIEQISDLAYIPIKLALVHDEVSEALQVHRNNYDDSDLDAVTQMTDMQEADFTEELADIVIRVLDVAGYFDLDIGDAVIEKIERNRNRPARHGKRY
jgi:NTP pyrophosphatase (non-canonical NTP hydrolase)